MTNRIVALHTPTSRLLVLFSVALFLNLATSPAAQAQTPGPEPSKECVTDNRKPEGLPLHSLTIKARGGRVPQISARSSAEPILVVDQPYTAKKLTATMEAVNRALLNDHENVDEALVGGGGGTPGGENKSLGVIAVLFINTCTRIVEGAVDAEIIPYYVRLERTKIGNLILPIPRSNRPTLFTQTPRALLAFNPKFGGNYDRKYGFSERAEISTNLLTLKPLLSDSTLPAEGNTRLNLHLMGQKSLNNPFYDSDATLSLKRLRPGKALESISIDGSFSGTEQPWGEGKYFRNAGSLRFNLEAHPQLGLLGKVTASGAYSFSGDRFFSSDGLLTEQTSENAFEGRAILDGRLAEGLVRLGIWADAASPKNLDSYHRVAGILGYQKEIPVALNQTIGVEAIVGAGGAWGAVPEYARFYAGNSLSSFLYDQTDEPSLTSFPTGPLLRSFGKSEGGNLTGPTLVRGGTSYWHFNLNVSIPIRGPKFSTPLIPAEVVDEDSGTTLKGIIKAQMNTAEVTISSDLQDGGTPEDVANKEAKRIVAQIRPAVNFIADQANIFSIKPLLMFDGANLKVPGSLDNRTRLGVGGGLQLTIVVAKFEAGYMRTVHALPGDKKGNFVTRIVFQNLF
jgi:hypothetical protein